MKSTKKLFNIIIFLTLTTFSSHQICAAMHPQINPYLTQQQRTFITNTIGLYTYFRDTQDCDAKKKLTPEDRDMCRRAPKVIAQLKAIYYGNRPYTDAEINNAEE
jgi:hypothetical protein